MKMTFGGRATTSTIYIIGGFKRKPGIHEGRIYFRRLPSSPFRSFHDPDTPQDGAGAAER